MSHTHARTLSHSVAHQSGKTVRLLGWVNRVRDHGGVLFFDVRDREGIVQVVVDPLSTQANKADIEHLSPESVVEVEGVVVAREERAINSSIASGAVEVQAQKFRVISRADVLPFPLHDQSGEIDESLRLRHRYLDLRRPAMRERLLLRHALTQQTYQYFSQRDFLEIETPILMKGTPEGSREFVVPSRLHHRKFYVLPQSPQQFKQLLMVAGVERYFQIARCFRDEDQRGDRQPEFTQLDLEMSFASREELMELIEQYLIEICGACVPHKQLRDHRLPRMTYAESMERYGNDKPDLRIGMELIDCTDVLKNTESPILRSAVQQGGVIRGMLVRDASFFSRKVFEELSTELRPTPVGGAAYVKFGAADEFQSSLARFLDVEMVRALAERVQARPGDILLLAAGDMHAVGETLSVARREVAKRNGAYDRTKDVFAFCWITDFPLFERDASGSISSTHHPFTMPTEEDVPLLDSDPLCARSLAYDVVLNGVEIGGGSIRIHDAALQRKVFKLLQLSSSTITARFGHILEAFQYGVPPHGGIALGLDRFLMLMTDQESIREVIPFPKNQSARDLMTGAPSPITTEQLDELGIRAVDKEEG
jgi:aspartyl-tRNA synthetase